MNESDVVRDILYQCPTYPGQQNRPFTSDAELVPIGNDLWAVTTDDFSAEEDLFVFDTWRELGWTLTVATLSDLLAVGAEPLFFLHALSIPRDASREMPRQMSGGIRDALDAAGGYLLGGDIGSASPWRCCGTALGVVAGEPLSREMPAEPQSVWVTGTLGDAAVAALTGAKTPAFELRINEARLIRANATACTDTSGGFFRSLWDLLQVSPQSLIELNRWNIPVDETAESVLKQKGLPPAGALLAGAGEYELLFTLPHAASAQVTNELTAAGCTCIGQTTPSQTSEVRIRHGEDHVTVMSEPPPDPRAVLDVDTHINEVSRKARELFP